MFSFLKFLQSIVNKLQRNKGLWFTILTVSSIAGVLISITLINVMTTSVANKIYMQVHRESANLLDNTLETHYDSLLSISGVVSIYPQVIQNIKTKSDKSIDDILLKAQKSINSRVNIDPVKLNYYAASYKATQSENFKYANLVIETSTSISGIVVNKEGVRIIAITPVMDANKTIGAIEVSQSIVALKNDFEKVGKEFSFILDKSQLVFINLKYKQGMLQDVGEQYKIFFHNYNPQFYSSFKKIDLDLLQRKKYFVNSDYYTTYNDVADIDGKEIGLFIVGESTKKANSFVNITKNLISSVTTVAIGLVISLILFMF